MELKHLNKQLHDRVQFVTVLQDACREEVVCRMGLEEVQRVDPVKDGVLELQVSCKINAPGRKHVFTMSGYSWIYLACSTLWMRREPGPRILM